MKNRHLRALGYLVIEIPHFHYDTSLTKRQKENYFVHLLKSSVLSLTPRHKADTIESHDHRVNRVA